MSVGSCRAIPVLTGLGTIGMTGLGAKFYDSSRIAAGVAFVLFVAAVLGGCSETAIEYTETKRIDEKITDDELQVFLRIVQRLPERQLPELPQIFAPAPDWNRARTLPVSELIHEEQTQSADRWTTEWLSRKWQKNRHLARVLRREQMTLEQFTGLTLALGAAISRSTIRSEQNLPSLLERGEAVIAELRKDKTPFDDHTRESQHNVLRQAAWITRVDRARRLGLVPPENVSLVQVHRDQLWTIFPSQFTTNPLDSIADLLEEKGLPFEELSESGSDEQIVWDPETALIGHSRADVDERPATESETAGSSPQAALGGGSRR